MLRTLSSSSSSSSSSARFTAHLIALQAQRVSAVHSPTPDHSKRSGAADPIGSRSRRRRHPRFHAYTAFEVRTIEQIKPRCTPLWLLLIVPVHPAALAFVMLVGLCGSFAAAEGGPAPAEGLRLSVRTFICVACNDYLQQWKSTWPLKCTTETEIPSS